MAKRKKETPLSDVDILVMHVDLGQEMARKFRVLNEEIDRLRSENARLRDENAGLENQIDQLDS